MSNHYGKKSVFHNVYAFGSKSTKANLSLSSEALDGMNNVNHYLLSLSRPLILGDGGQDGGCLLAAHHRDS